MGIGDLRFCIGFWFGFDLFAYLSLRLVCNWLWWLLGFGWVLVGFDWLALRLVVLF